MKDHSKSSFIFDLIEEFEIFNASGMPDTFTDEAYSFFCKKYEALSIERDRALYHYLNSTDNVFRCHLPRSKWVLGVAPHIVWYYDEIIISDPVLELIRSADPNPDHKKQQLCTILSNLRDLKGSIQAGYLLLSGDNIIPIRTTQFEQESNRLIEIPEVLQAFEEASIFGKKASPINNIPADNLVQLEALYDGHFGTVRPMAMHFPPHVLAQNKIANGVNYDFMSPYTRSTKQEIIKYGRADMLDPLINEYKKDIAVILETIVNAQQFGLPILFYRDVDHVIAREYSIRSSKQRHISTNNAVYNCVLPYIEGIPPERLAEIRDKLPSAFTDFRAFLFDLVQRTMKSTDNPAEIKFKIDSEVNAKLRLLDVEMMNASRKLLAHGYGAPILLMAGSLAVYSSGLNYHEILSIILGSQGVIKTLMTYNDVIADKEKAALNPVYFIWKAQQESI